MASPMDSNERFVTIAKISIWNNCQLSPPPTVTYSYTSGEIDKVCPGQYQKLLSGMVMMSIQYQKYLELERFTSARLLFKLHNQLNRWKWYQLLTKIVKILCRIRAVNISKYVEDLQECCYKSKSSTGMVIWYLPSQQMVAHLLVKLMSTSKLCGYAMALCEKTAVFLVQFLGIGHMVNTNIVFCAITSRIWVLLQALQSQLIQWYGDIQDWYPKLKATPTPFLPSDQSLPSSLSTWLVSDKPTNLKRKSKTQKLLSKWFSEAAHNATENALPDDSMDAELNMSLSVDLGEPVCKEEVLNATVVSHDENVESKNLSSRAVKIKNIKVTQIKTEDQSSVKQDAKSDMTLDESTKKKKKKKNKRNLNNNAANESENNAFKSIPASQTFKHNNATTTGMWEDFGKFKAATNKKLTPSVSGGNSRRSKKKKDSDSLSEEGHMQLHKSNQQFVAEPTFDGHNHGKNSQSARKRKRKHSESVPEDSCTNLHRKNLQQDTEGITAEHIKAPLQLQKDEFAESNSEITKKWKKKKKGKFGDVGEHDVVMERKLMLEVGDSDGNSRRSKKKKKKHSKNVDEGQIQLHERTLQPNAENTFAEQTHVPERKDEFSGENADRSRKKKMKRKKQSKEQNNNPLEKNEYIIPLLSQIDECNDGNSKSARKRKRKHRESIPEDSCINLQKRNIQQATTSEQIHVPIQLRKVELPGSNNVRTKKAKKKEKKHLKDPSVNDFKQKKWGNFGTTETAGEKNQFDGVVFAKEEKSRVGTNAISGNWSSQSVCELGKLKHSTKKKLLKSHDTDACIDDIFSALD